MRITWIDSAKAYGMVLVFYGHILERFTEIGNRALLLQYKFIYAFHMPLFFVLSGYFSKNEKLNLKYRIASRIVPFIFFNLIACPLEVLEDILLNEHPQNVGYYAFSILSLIRGYPMFNFMTWFLICLFTVETIDFFILRYIKSKGILMIVAIGIYLVGQIVNFKSKFFTDALGISVNFWYFNEALTAYLFYTFGKFLKKSNLLEAETPLSLQLLVLISVGLCLVFTFNLNSTVNMSSSTHGNFILFPITAIAGSMFVILLAKLIPSSKIINFIGKNTLILIGINGLFVHLANEEIARFIRVFLSDSHLRIVEVCGTATLICLILSIPCIVLLNRFIPQLVGKPKSNGPFLKSLA